MIEGPSAARGNGASSRPESVITSSTAGQTNGKSAATAAPGQQVDREKPNETTKANSGKGGGRTADSGKSNENHSNGNGRPADGANGGDSSGNGPAADQGKPVDTGLPSLSDEHLDTPVGQADVPHGPKP